MLEKVRADVPEGDVERRNITRADLAQAVLEVPVSGHLAARQASALVDEVLEEISGTLASGERVVLTKFGAFDVRDKAERVGRNPKTLEPAPIPARRVVVFRACNGMKDEVARGNTSTRRG